MHPQALAPAAPDPSPLGFPPWWLNFLGTWNGAYGDRVVATQTLVPLLDDADTNDAAARYRHRWNRTLLNELLWRARGQAFGVLFVEAVGPFEGGGLTYRLRVLAPIPRRDRTGVRAAEGGGQP